MLKTHNPIRIKACFSLVCAAVLFLHPFKLSNVKISGHIVTSTEFVTVGGLFIFFIGGKKTYLSLCSMQGASVQSGGVGLRRFPHAY